MLRIKRVRRYRRAKYPRKTYRRARSSPAASVAKGGASSLLLMALTEACDPLGTVGPPPVVPDMVTENDARLVIDRVFIENGIALQKDFPLVFRWAQDSLAFQVDGFNESLQVGYEYLDPDGESPVPTQEFQTALEAAGNTDGPYIELVGPIWKDGSHEELLETEILAFIEKLKGMGVI